MKSLFLKSVLILNIIAQCFLSFFTHPYSQKLTLKLRRRLQKLKNINFHVRHIEFEKINVLLIRNVTIVSSVSNLTIETLKVHLNFSMSSSFKLLRVSFFAKNVDLVLQSSESKSTNNPADHNRQSLNGNNFKPYYNFFFRFIKPLVKNFPESIDIDTLNLTLYLSGRVYNSSLKNFVIHNNFFSACFTGSIAQGCSISGSFIKKPYSFEFANIQFSSNSKVCFFSHNMQFSFQELSFEVSLLNATSVSLNFSITNGFLQIPHISSEKVIFSEIRWHIDTTIENSKFLIKETSFFTYNKLKLHFSVVNVFPENILKVRTFSDRFTMDEFFMNFRSFRYKPLYSLKFDGQVSSIEFTLAINLNQPWRHIVKLKIQENLKLVCHKGWLSLKSNFLHKIMDNGNFVRHMEVSEENKNFICFSNICPTLIQTILYTEDPDFFEHNGVHEKFLGLAIVQNLNEKKFARGASTISMQLVRNLFLNHEKTVLRKFEEVLITLLIENVFKLPKKRILELYLNIIEFGPNIYGVKEACEYYFQKQPSHLTTRECLILSYIIPRPKFFMEAFINSTEQLKKNLKHHIEVFSEKLLKSGYIDEKQAREMLDPISIRGKLLALKNEKMKS